MNPKPPVPPREAYFDTAEDAWILTRYANVTAALRETNLWPPGKNEVQQETRDETGRLRIRPAVVDFLSGAKLEQWQTAAKCLAEAQLDRLAAGNAEILGDFAKPWCMSLAMIITGAPPEEHDRLAA